MCLVIVQDFAGCMPEKSQSAIAEIAPRVYCFNEFYLRSG
jgi:hypothetical protein